MRRVKCVCQSLGLKTGSRQQRQTKVSHFDLIQTCYQAVRKYSIVGNAVLTKLSIDSIVEFYFSNEGNHGSCI